VSDVARSAASSSLSPHPSPIAKFEPEEDRFPDSEHYQQQEQGEESGRSDGESEIDQLIAPTRHLVVSVPSSNLFSAITRNLQLQGDDLELYGPTSAYRLAPERVKDNDLSCVCIDPSNTTPILDWSRHLPPEAPLTKTEHDRLLDLLFRFCTSWCWRVIPKMFFRDMHQVLSLPPSATPPRTSHYSPMLHNAALALACAFSDNPAVTNIEFRRHFAQKAKSYIDIDVLQPNVCLVTALGLIATFHSSRGEQSLGYLYAGKSGPLDCRNKYLDSHLTYVI
jgi:hypothetical protein